MLQAESPAAQHLAAPRDPAHFEGGLARGPLRYSNPSVPQPRMDARLEERHEGTIRLPERPSGQRNEGSEKRLQALEGLGNAFVIGRG